MAIVKYPEFSVKIAIKDAESGVLNNATFSGELDPQSLDLTNPTNLVSFRKKNVNAKPFIWGISKWNDKSTHYNKNDYKGIATKGNGVGAVITLVFSEPTSHFTMYFDENVQSMPLKILSLNDRTGNRLENISFNAPIENSNYKLQGIVGSPEISMLSNSTISLIPSNIYYIGFKAKYLNNPKNMDIYFPVAEPSFASGLSNQSTEKWVLNSERKNRSGFSAGNYPIRIDNNNQNENSTCYVDKDIVCYNLTALHGSGNEPTKEYMDSVFPFNGKGVEIENDDYMFSYSQDTPQTEFKFLIQDMNEVNGEKMPLMIIGVEAKIELDITHRTGLKSVRASRSFTSDREKPSYGILSQEGALNIFDFYTEIDDLIKMDLLTSDKAVEIEFADNLVGKYTTDEWTEQQTSLFSVSLNDRLLQWQEQNVARKYDLEFDKTAKYLYNYLVSLSPDLEFVLDSTTDSHLQAIKIKYYYWEASTEWNFWQKLCDLAQLYVYPRFDGKVVVISQKRINEIKDEKTDNPVIVPYKLIDNKPKIDRLTKNKIDKVEIVENSVSYDYDDFYHYDPINITLSKTDPVATCDNQEYSISVFHSSKEQEPYFEDGMWISVENALDFNLLNFIMPYDINTIIMESELSKTEYLMTFKKGLLGSGDVKTQSTSKATEKKQLTTDDTPYSWINNPLLTINNDILNIDAYLRITAYFDGLLTQDATWTDFASSLLNFKLKNKILKTSELKIEFGETGGANIHRITSNEFIGNETKINNVKISEHNANQILNNFTGKQTISFSCAIDTLKYKEHIYKLQNPYKTYYGGADFSTGASGIYDLYVYEDYEIVDDVVILKNKVTNFDDIIVGKTYYMGYENLLYVNEIVQKNINPTFPFQCLVNEASYRVEDMKTDVAYEYNNGEILKELELIQLKQTDGTLEPEIWQVTKVEIEASSGRNFINVEGVQI